MNLCRMSRRFRCPAGLWHRMAAALAAAVLWHGGSGLSAQSASEAVKLFETLELAEGMTAGEIGAGRGDMSIAIAKRLGSSGRMFSNELDPKRLEEIRQGVAREGLATVTVVESGELSTNLPDACCDAIFMRDVYHHFTNPADIAKSLVTALRPGGRLAVIDFRPRGSDVPAGVPSDRGGHGVPPDTVVQELTAAGLTHVRTIAEWPETGGGRRRLFLVLFRKPA